MFAIVQTALSNCYQYQNFSDFSPIEGVNFCIFTTFSQDKHLLNVENYLYRSLIKSNIYVLEEKIVTPHSIVEETI